MGSRKSTFKTFIFHISYLDISTFKLSLFHIKFYWIRKSLDLSVLLSKHLLLSITPSKWVYLKFTRSKVFFSFKNLKKKYFVERNVNIIHSADYRGSGKLDYLLFPSVLALDYLIDSFGLCTLHYPPWIDFKSLNMNAEELNRELIHSVS